MLRPRGPPHRLSGCWNASSTSAVLNPAASSISFILLCAQKKNNLCKFKFQFLPPFPYFSQSSNCCKDCWQLLRHRRVDLLDRASARCNQNFSLFRVQQNQTSRTSCDDHTCDRPHTPKAHWHPPLRCQWCPAPRRRARSCLTAGTGGRRSLQVGARTQSGLDAWAAGCRRAGEAAKQGGGRCGRSLVCRHLVRSSFGGGRRTTTTTTTSTSSADHRAAAPVGACARCRHGCEQGGSEVSRAGGSAGTSHSARPDPQIGGRCASRGRQGSPCCTPPPLHASAVLATLQRLQAPTCPARTCLPRCRRRRAPQPCRWNPAPVKNIKTNHKHDCADGVAARQCSRGLAGGQ